MMTPAERRAADVKQIRRYRDEGLRWIQLEQGKAQANVTNPDARREIQRIYDQKRAELNRDVARREAEAGRLADVAGTSRAVGVRQVASGPKALGAVARGC
jgi:uncharacterized protein involved in exopolysaccharide biosynthesis